VAVNNAQYLVVSLGDRSYPILIGSAILDNLPSLLEKVSSRARIAVITDTHVGPLYGQQVQQVISSAGYTVKVYSFPAGETEKNLHTVEALCGQLLADHYDRTSAIVALGGGVVGDLAGFVAAVYMRGIPYFQIPTTIVGQVDSSVGGKTGVNHALAKNSIGAFHQPLGVLIDLALLQTLPDNEYRAGLAEVIKHGMIADPDLFLYMEKQASAILAHDWESLQYPVRRSCEIKAGIVAQDERESGIRAYLNYGHTFGHAIETVTHYRRFLHGEAVAIGMCAAAYLAHRLGMIDQSLVERQEQCIQNYGLPTAWSDLPIDETLEVMYKDKKARGGTLRLVLPLGLGSVCVRDDVPIDLVREALRYIRER
jgi:3-dehydroquinate synthase